MTRELLALLRSPETGAPLELHDAVERDGRVESGTLATAAGAHEYPIVGGIPRFVPPDNYASSFGFQWNRFRRTQLDSHSGVPISRDRFYRYSGWTQEELRGRNVLDVGCGAGRFTEVALDAGARVVSIDYSAAVDACQANHAGCDRHDVIQADVFRLPFAPDRFDFVFCFGVLQHTPDPRAAFQALAAQLAPGGRIAVDLYPRLLRNLLWPKYWLRPLTRRLPQRALFGAVEKLMPVLLPVSIALGRVPRVGRQLRWAIPVANYDGIYPLDREQLREWAVLDTFDMLSPAHDHPQSAATLCGWLEDAQLMDVHVERVGFLVGRGRRP
jgi:SAM-dependent methyltransferase